MISTQRILKHLSRAQNVQLRTQCSSSNGGDAKKPPKPSTQKIEINGQKLEIPSPPTNCCMSGCANCVWIEYAESLASKLRDGTSVARDIIMSEVEDPNMRTFLEMELRILSQRTKK